MGVFDTHTAWVDHAHPPLVYMFLMRRRNVCFVFFVADHDLHVVVWGTYSPFQLHPMLC